MSKEMNVNSNTSMDELKNIIKGFIHDNIRYDEEYNHVLLNNCRNNIGSDSERIKKDLLELKRIIKGNKGILRLLDEPYESGYRIMSFEKDQFDRLKKQLKSKYVNDKNGAYYWCIHLELLKSHNNTMGYLDNQLKRVEAMISEIGFIPPREEYELITKEFQETIITALDDLEEQILEEKINKKRCK